MKHFRSLFVSAVLSGAVFCQSLSGTAASIQIASVQPTVESGLYEIASFPDENLVLELQTCTVTEKEEHPLQLYPLLDTNQQKFYIEKLAQNTYRISTLTTGEALTAELPDGFLDSGITIDLQADTSDLAEELQEDELYSAAVFLDVMDHTVDEEIMLLETETEAETEATTEAVSEAETETTTKAVSESETEAAVILEKETEIETESEPEFIMEIETESAAEIESVIIHPQLWSFEPTDDGFFYIHSANGKYLTLESRYAYTGESVVLKNFTGNDNQKWSLTKTWSSPADPVDTDLINPYAEDGAYRNFKLKLKFGEKVETLTAEDFSAWMLET